MTPWQRAWTYGAASSKRPDADTWRRMFVRAWFEHALIPWNTARELLDDSGQRSKL